jgi:hypothetical protein
MLAPSAAAAATRVGVGVLVGIEASAVGASVGGSSTTGASVGGASTTGASVGGASTTGASVGGASTTGASVASVFEAPDKNSPPGAHDAMRSDSMTVREIILKILKLAFVFIITSILIMAVMPKKVCNNDNSYNNE